jgi:phosphotransferase system HPr-like phosphotransfer protein
LASHTGFKQKAEIFSYDYLKCCVYIDGLKNTPNAFTKKLFAELIAKSRLLEDFLDFHGAKNSKKWYFYRELTAAVRYLSISSYTQKHISNRLIHYDLDDTLDFNKQGETTLEMLTSILTKLAPVILDEARRLNIRLPEEVFNNEDFSGLSADEFLKNDIDDGEKDQQKKHIVKIASEFLRIADKFDHLGFYEPYSLEEIEKIVPHKINEVEIRRFEMLVHNLQSSFDTYVIHGGYRFGNRKLKSLRSFFSVVFHLFQMIGPLLHFYERHLMVAGYKNIYKKTRDRLAEIIRPDQLLDRTINYGLFFACHFLNDGKELAKEILNENIERASITVGVPQKLGFHSRPSLLVAKIVQHYGGQVELCVGEDKFDASSVLDIQWAGGKIQNENIKEVVFDGDARALADIEILAGVNYGEDTMGKGVPLPNELKYLR